MHPITTIKVAIESPSNAVPFNNKLHKWCTTYICPTPFSVSHFVKMRSHMHIQGRSWWLVEHVSVAGQWLSPCTWVGRVIWSADDDNRPCYTGWRKWGLWLELCCITGVSPRQHCHQVTMVGPWLSQQAFLNVLTKNMWKNIFWIDTLFSLLFKEINGGKKNT